MASRNRKSTHCLRGILSCVVLVVVLAGCSAGPYLVAGADGPQAGREGLAAALEALLGPTPWPADATADAPALDVDALERAIHDRVNAVRAAHGLPPLAWADRLAPVARGHSADMAAHAYFDHLDRNGEDATRRAQRRDAGSDGVAENLFLTHRFAAYTALRSADGATVYRFEWKTPRELAEQTVAAWLQSPTHRENLLYPRYTAESIGVAPGLNATVFVTQNLVSDPAGRLASR